MHAVWLLGVYVLILVIGIVLVVATGLLMIPRIRTAGAREAPADPAPLCNPPFAGVASPTV